MKTISISDLLPFQKYSSSELAIMIQEYPNGRFKARYDSETGKQLPFLCRLRAITGAGKTPILCYTASLLGNGIILWTTNRGAVVSQTFENLQPGGKYSPLLPTETSVYSLAEMSSGDWDAILNARGGLTILLTTVAAFNQQGETLKIHRKNGNFTRWQMLGNTDTDGRKRPLYVFYDEGHGATTQQFEKLRELNPKAFVLASASPLPDDLTDLLSGKTVEEKEKSLKERTVIVPTKDVVEAGLLKKRLYLIDCDTTQADAVKESHNKWTELSSKLSKYNQYPIVCFIVNETTRGIDIWEHLINLGVSKSHIAVHLNGAADTIRDRYGSLMGMIDTYSGKALEDRSPQRLKTRGYTHIIWNMTLREGWDEPFAYVAYIDDRGRSITDIVQKIGRFVRQPNAISFDDPDLNAAYFYFKVEDEDFASLVRETQREMEAEGYEVVTPRNTKIPSSRIVEVLRPQTIPSISPWFGPDVKERDQIILNNITLYADKALQSVGSIRTRVIDMLQIEEDETQRLEEKRESNDVITPWEYLMARLAKIDSRLLDERGTIFSVDLQNDEIVTQRMQYNSSAMRAIDQAIPRIREQLNEKLELVNEGAYGLFTIKPFKLISPDIMGVPENTYERYKVRPYNHAVHPAYNGMNPFEVAVASALDSLGKVWCRNPVEGGYKIPIPYLGAESIWFYPDFLLWTDKEIWAIDPKGNHLYTAAVQSKLLDLTMKDRTKKSGKTPPIRVALLLKGKYTRDQELRWIREDTQGHTLIRKVGVEIKVKTSDSLNALVKSLVSK
jgi:type III restriction enzyme